MFQEVGTETLWLCLHCNIKCIIFISLHQMYSYYENLVKHLFTYYSIQRLHIL